MKKIVRFLFSTLVIVLFSNLVSFAQISNGGTPYSILYGIDNNYTQLRLQSPDMQSVNAEDLINEAANPNSPRRMGVSIAVNKNMKNSGTWTTIPDVGKVWRLQISAKGALALGVYFDDFYIPDGGELFLYNAEKTQIIGAFNSNNNPDSHLFSTEFIEGDKVILEYFQPNNVTVDANIDISEVAYAYRDIDYSIDQNKDAWYCMIDVACEEGDNWENQIRGVARISIKIGGSYYWCSGSLINNTENDRTPYFLTAAHCGEGSNSNDRTQWIFYFNYQANTCNGTNTGSNTTTGCELKANDPSAANNGSDFFLVQFSNAVPSFYNVYYNGWNRTNETDDAGNGVGIHHPAGDIKKISTYDTPLASSTFWNGLPTHWKLNWAPTVNGLSIMQGGSSGSPVFDSNGLIMGDLTGGYASNSCSNPSPAYYGKIWYSWDINGTTPSTRLKDWLDPNNTGIEKLPGISWEIILPTADFVADTTIVTQGDTVFFTDLSNPGVYGWDWTFEGGDPATSSEKNPWTVYSDTGYMDVTLIATNGDGSDTELKTDYIYVNPMAAPVTDFEADPTHLLPGSSTHFTDLSSGNPIEWHWTFEGGSPGVSTLQNPVVRFNNEGIYTITLVAINLGGSDTLVKQDYIVVGGTAPVADFTANTTTIMQGDAVNFTDLSLGDPTEWQWEFEGGTPNISTDQNPQSIVYNEGGSFNVTLTVTNDVGTDTKLVEDYILVDWVGIDDFKSMDDFVVYPNPGSGKFVLKFASSDKNIAIDVTNAKGKNIYSDKDNIVKDNFVLDLSAQPEGIYFIAIRSNNITTTKKITIIK